MLQEYEGGNVEGIEMTVIFCVFFSFRRMESTTLTTKNKKRKASQVVVNYVVEPVTKKQKRFWYNDIFDCLCHLFNFRELQCRQVRQYQNIEEYPKDEITRYQFRYEDIIKFFSNLEMLFATFTHKQMKDLIHT
jgi:hypothetical protein